MSTQTRDPRPISSPAFALKTLCGLILLLATFFAPATLAWEFDLDHGHARAIKAPWAENEEWLLRALSEGTVLRTEPIGTGVTNPFKAEIEYEEQRVHAVWKPLRATDFEVYESYPAEISAYRLSKYLGLDMVPPTVRRKIGRRWGSLQFWVDGHRTFAEAAATRPYDFESSDQIQLLRLFDALIDNPDRNAGNFLVDPSYQVVLIDHSRALNFESTERQRDGSMPSRFQASVVEKLRHLDLGTLDELLGDLLTRGDRRSLNLSAKRLVKFIDQQIAAHGPVIVFERPRLAVDGPIEITQNNSQ